MGRSEKEGCVVQSRAPADTVQGESFPRRAEFVVLALERLTFLEPEGKVGYRSGEKGSAPETMDYLEFIACQIVSKRVKKALQIHCSFYSGF